MDRTRALSLALLLLVVLAFCCDHADAAATRKKTRGKKRPPKINLDHKHMIELEMDTFEETVTDTENTPWMVMFYEFRDPNSQKYMPAYEKLATVLKDSDINVARLDIASAPNEFFVFWDIRGWPTYERIEGQNYWKFNYTFERSTTMLKDFAESTYLELTTTRIIGNEYEDELDIDKEAEAKYLAEITGKMGREKYQGDEDPLADLRRERDRMLEEARARQRIEDEEKLRKKKEDVNAKLQRPDESGDVQTQQGVRAAAAERVAKNEL